MIYNVVSTLTLSKSVSNYLILFFLVEKCHHVSSPPIYIGPALDIAPKRRKPGKKSLTSLSQVITITITQPLRLRHLISEILQCKLSCYPPHHHVFQQNFHFQNVPQHPNALPTDPSRRHAPLAPRHYGAFNPFPGRREPRPTAFHGGILRSTE